MALPRAAASPTPTSISLANKIVIFGLMLWVNVMWAPRNPKRAACRAGRAVVMNVMQNSEALIEGGFQQNIQLMLSASQTVWKRRCFLPRIRVTVQQTDENEPFYGRLIESRCAGFLLKFSWWGETGCPEGPVQRMNKLPLLCCLTSSLGMKRLKINSWEIPGGICGLGVSRFLCPLQDPGKCCFVGTGGWGEGNNFSHLFFWSKKLGFLELWVFFTLSWCHMLRSWSLLVGVQSRRSFSALPCHLSRADCPLGWGMK